jgi:radical SAM protein with 4Fe4S-binding SPASM domain
MGVKIDVYGNIKNCPSMKKSFGNINDISLQEALTDQKFKEYWNVSKDQIEKCNECQFRYMCQSNSEIREYELGKFKKSCIQLINATCPSLLIYSA